MIKSLMNDGANTVDLSYTENRTRATLTVKNRDHWGDEFDEYDYNIAEITINKKEAKQIIEGLKVFICQDS